MLLIPFACNLYFISFIDNVEVYLKAIRGNAILSTKGLLELARILKMCRNLNDYFYSKDSLNSEDYAILDNYFNSLYTNKNIEDAIILNESSSLSGKTRRTVY